MKKGFVPAILIFFYGCGPMDGSKQVSYEQMVEMTEKAALECEVPVSMDGAVEEKLDQFLNTREGRAKIDVSLDKLASYETVIKEKAEANGVPKELMAIPIIESGYENTAVSSAKAKGVWQFMAPTARDYGLKVNSKKDDRLDVEKATDAAMQFLGEMYDDLEDWRLSILAYNQGQARVLDLIDEYETRDPWKLEEQGTENSYLSSVIAAMIVLKNRGF